MAKAITREAAAAELSCSTRTIDRMRESGELDEIEFSAGGGVRILVSSIDELIERKSNAARRRRTCVPEVGRPVADVTDLRASLLKARKKKKARGRG